MPPAALRQLPILVATCLAGLCAEAAAQTSTSAAPPRPAIRAIRATEVIVLDGRLDEAVWQVAQPADGFLQREPDEGRPATQATEIRIAYDDDAIYVGARMFDSEPGRIHRRLSRRDDDGNSDRIAIGLDPRRDRLTGAAFTVTAAGTLIDEAIYDDTSTDATWDGVWDAKVAVDEDGWTAEMRIPLSQLRFPAGDRQTWGFNAMRTLQRRNEESWWVLTARTQSGLASRFGDLEGLDGLAPRRHLEVLPYVTSRAEFLGTADARDPFNDGTRGGAGVGLDAKWGVTSNFTLDGTINPDFGQVEVDPAVVNLSAFETFFEEKRPFFIEGASLYDAFGRNGPTNRMGFNRSNPTLFYSRRIGRAPQGAAPGDYVDRPAATTIAGAAKLTGKTALGWSVSLIEALTTREDARVSQGALRSDVEVEPVTNYLATRIHRSFGQRGGMGMLATSVTRNLDDPALERRLARQATVFGGDGHWFLNRGRDWVMTGSLAGSHVSGSPDALARLQQTSTHYFQRPDAPHVTLDRAATSMSGWSGQFDFNRNTGTLRPNASLWAVSPGFESNDAGFVSRADAAGSHLALNWRKASPDRYSRYRQLLLAKWWSWNFARELQGDGYFADAYLQLPNYWELQGQVHYGRSTLADRLTRGGPSLMRPSFLSTSLSLETDARRPVVLDVSASHARDGLDGFETTFGIELLFKPSASLSIETGPSVMRQTEPLQYVHTSADPAAAAMAGARYVFADLRQTEVVLETRVNYIVTPRMSVQVYAQPLISNGRYSGFKEPARPRTLSFLRYGQDLGSIGYDASRALYTVDAGGGPFSFRDPDFNLTSLRVNAVFRWEFRLGSTLYAVWTQQRADADARGRFALGPDLSRLWSAPGDNVLMLKVSYWLSR